MAKPKTLLLVEDDLAIREALTRVLLTENFRVVSASYWSEALLGYDEASVDLVLVDLNLGDEDGWEVFHALKELSPELPIIVTSAQAGRLAHSSATRANAVLEKPFDIPVLLGLLREAIRADHVRLGIAQPVMAAALMLFAVCLPWVSPAQSPENATPFKISGLMVQNGSVIVSWQGGGATNQLQRATSINGPWQNFGLPTTRSSATNPLAGPIAFFRVMTTVANASLTASL